MELDQTSQAREKTVSSAGRWIAAIAFAALALGSTMVLLAAATPHASAASGGGCDSFVVSDNPTQWRVPVGGAWTGPSQVQPKVSSWTAFPNGGPGTPTPRPIWANNLNTTSAFDFRNTFTACGGKYVLDITADNNYLAWVNTTDTTSGALVASCLDPNGYCFTGYHHSNFTPSCTTCQISVRGVNFGSFDMVQYRLQWCSGTLSTTASLSGTLGTNSWYRSAVTTTLTPTNACGSPQTYYSIDGGAFTLLAVTPGSVTVSTEGSHTIQYYSVDGLGQEATKSVSFKIDTVAPTCTGSYSGTLGTNGWYKVAGSETLATSDATSGVATTSYALNGGTSTSYTGPFSVTTQGTDTVACTVIDNAGNTGTATHTFKLDSVAPSACAGSYSGTLGTNGWYKATGSETLTPSDATSGVAATSYVLDGGSSTTYSAPFSITGDSAGHTLSCAVTDNAGNVASFTLANVKIDTTPPTSCTGSYSGTLGNNGWYKSTGSVTLTGADALSGPGPIAYVLDGGSSASYSSPFAITADGTHTLTCTVTDLAGNTAAAFTLANVKIDATAPTCSGSYSGTLGTNGWYKTAGSETLSTSDATSGVASTTYTLNGGASTTYGSPFSITTQGTNTVVCNVTDNAGNVASATLTVKLDSVAPSACTGSYSGTLGNNGWYKTTGSETLTGSDATSGVATITRSLDGGTQTAYSTAFAITGDSTGHTVSCVVTDNAGNSATLTASNSPIKIDTAPPTTCTGSYSGTLGNNGWYTTTGSETLTGADATSGVASITRSLDSGTQTAYSTAFAITGDSTGHTVSCVVTDNAGNGATLTATNSPIKIDTTPPNSCTGSYSGTLGTNGWYKTTGSETLTRTDATSGVATTNYVLDGGASTAYSAPFSITGDSAGHTLRCTVTDNAGNVASFTLPNVKIDTTPPTSCTGSYSGTLGNNGWYVATGSETLTGADALSGPGPIAYVLDGGSSASYSSPFEITGDGTHTLTCTVTDNAGNSATFTLADLKIDTTPPSDCTGSYSGALGDAGWYVKTGNETLTGVDATSGPGPISYALDARGSANYSAPFAITGDGTHTLTCTVTDLAGNTASPFTLADLKIDTTPPTVAIARPLAGRTYLDGQEVSTPAPPPYTTLIGPNTVTGNASDATSGVARVEFYVDGALRATATAAPYSWNWSAGDETPGAHDLALVAVDVAGNHARTNMTVTTAPDPFDVVCKDVPPVIEIVRTPGGQVIGLLGQVIPLPGEVSRIVKSAGIVCDPPQGRPGGPGNPCGEVRAQELNTTVAATVTYSVDPNGIVHVYWCIWANSTTLAPLQPALDPAKHVYVGTDGRVDYIYTVECQAPFSVHAVAGDAGESRWIRVTC